MSGGLLSRRNRIARLSLLSVLSVFVFTLLSEMAIGADTLQDAYKKEAAFLEAQRESFENRLKTLRQKSADRIQQAENALEALQRTLLQKSAQADTLADKLYETERANDTASQSAEMILTMKEQATDTLTRHGVMPERMKSEQEGEPKPEFVSTIFERGVQLLNERDDIKKREGAFFSTSGEKLQGEIIHIGAIAAYGVSDKQSGALAPAGDGKLKIWNEKEAEKTATTMAKNERSPWLHIFLFESLDKAMEERSEKTWVGVIESGGVIAWIIVLLGIFTLLMILARTSFLLTAGSRTDRLITQLAPMIEQGWLDEAIQHCKKNHGAAARVLAATVRNLDKKKEHLEDIISESLLHETPFLDRFGSAILVFATVAPLLGLLGTVTGMISTFDVITEFGTGDPRMLSGGISEALVTTKLGLIVAIPALLLGNLLSGWASGIRFNMEHAALRVVNLYQTIGETRRKSSKTISNEKLEEIPKEVAGK